MRRANVCVFLLCEEDIVWSVDCFAGCFAWSGFGGCSDVEISELQQCYRDYVPSFATGPFNA